MKHYIVLCAWRTGGGEGVDIKGVFHSEDEAKDLFKKELVDVILDADDWGMDWDHDGQYYFEANGDQWNQSYYIKLCIKEA